MTPAEDVFCRIHVERGQCYRFQQGSYSPYYRIVDFYLPDHNLIIEIDGPCHNVNPPTEPDSSLFRQLGTS